MKKNPSRREREREQRINYVLNVAEKLFAEKGFVKVTMQQIAQKAEFALGTLYSFFKGKKHIYTQMIDTKLEQFVSFIEEEISSETNPRQQVEKFIEAKLTYLRNNLAFLQLYFAEMHAPQLFYGQEVGRGIKKRYDDLIANLSNILNRGISEGIFMPSQPEALANALDGLTNALALPWLKKVPSSSPLEEIKTVKEVFLNGTLARP